MTKTTYYYVQEIYYRNHEVTDITYSHSLQGLHTGFELAIMTCEVITNSGACPISAITTQNN